MRAFDVKHVKTDPRNGHLVYRRRVPKVLAGWVRGPEFVKTLGHTTQEALIAYGPYHQYIEHLLSLAKHGVVGLSPTEQNARLTAMLQSWGADPHGPGRDDNERTWREVEADSMVDPYRNQVTGDYDGVPEDVGVIATALYKGVTQKKPEPTLTDAFKFYLIEKENALPEQRRKQLQRFARAERNLIAVVGSDKAVSDVTREDARNWRDLRVAAKLSPATIQREKNDISAVIGLAQTELDAGGINPFSRLKLPKSNVSRQDERDPLPVDVIAGVYAALAQKQSDLLAIWTLLDFTGARPSEVSQLQVGEIVLNHAVPHIIIRPRDDRTLKTSWSTRTVPLVGAALEAATETVRGASNPADPAFPRFYGDGGMDRLSAALNRRVRVHTKNPRHVCYSLRHNVKDRLRAAEIFHDTQTAIQGHASGRGEEAAYGSGPSLEQKQVALSRALAGYDPLTETPRQLES